MDRQNYATGTPWEPIVGYSRAVKIRNFVYVSGTTATDKSGALVGIDDAAAQTKQIILNIESALQYFGGTLADVYRTRIYVKDISQWEAIGRVHGETFCNILPATSMVEVSNLISADVLVEIEADAFVASDKIV